ncbi:hypothetical protein AGABI1DRAFT_133088 [Agaricus bisporus var. burnettii JB137-S8]|uniref:BZIP domain-containing protein n=1 Tax=Agaricus bisporus var. burnettii (strain JB137-S8 / ATCC MYA-4627 / FGSC 10392) TaxID=597362 RepID=K5WH76_AGABU|nr:uncharacterized protein AGABI1DRAFT_133088 [Agaricus bisporus var. burnettii JB137-S8]EKM74586.1 hypothetical protein AGABI1DRAFT_133088 [Agaricus bisporus var. burnettii JB137-S8]
MRRLPKRDLGPKLRTVFELLHEMNTLDIDQFLNADLFAQPSPASAASSHPSTPDQALLTPPQPAPLAAFQHDAPDYSLFDDEPKQIGDYGFLAPGPAALDPALFALDLPYPFLNLPHDQMAIDPQLVGTPASTAPPSDFDDDDGADEDLPPPPSLSIAPIKVGGHGKARRGTVQSGGIVKKSATSRDKENLIASALSSNLPLSSSSVISPSSSGKSLPKPPAILKSSASKKGKAKEDEEDDDDDVPQDWRPSPEVFAKMTSKEKRQLRNKISARNFRVRRKEYISTLEGDIAERDRLLDAIRSELGTTQSENSALRQEIASLKKVLLEGRGASATDLPLLNLPPPAPLPLGTLPAAAATPAPVITPAITNDTMLSPPTTPPAQHQQTNATVNTHKDIPRNGNATSAFWGGQPSSILGGGITPVHTTLVPEIHVGLWGSTGAAATKKILGESNANAGMNMNPLLNMIGAGNAAAAEKIKGVEKVNNVTMVPGGLSGFDAFADSNLFTMKSLDAYRMQLWGKMAAQHHAHHLATTTRHQIPSPTLSSSSLSSSYSSPSPPSSHSGLSGHASGLRPAFFSSPTLSLKSSSSSSSSSSFGGLLTPPMSPRLSINNNIEREKEKEREAQAAMLAVVASQTLFKKLGNAFWDAFSGSGSGPSGPGGLAIKKKWDADKVRKVLEGKAVVRVVDVDPLPAAAAATSPTTMMNNSPMDTRKCVITEMLEEGMRSLSINLKPAEAEAGEKEKRV